MEDYLKIIRDENTTKNDEISNLEEIVKTKNNIFKRFILKPTVKIKNKFIWYYSNYNNYKEKNKKFRNPGVDIIRLIGMFGIIINHLLYMGDKGGMHKYSKFSKYLKLVHIFIFWHNNGFILISGIVGYKTQKYSNLFYLWLEVVFYSVGINLYFSFFRKSSFLKGDISKDCFPIIFKKYWYFTAYFGMYLFLPIINKGISLLSKSEFRLVVLSTLGLFVFWKDLKNPNSDVFDMKSGFSMIWILTYYLTGAYIGKYRIIYTGIKKYIHCIICLFIYLFSISLFFIMYNNNLYFGNKDSQKQILSLLKPIFIERFDSIFIVIQSISISLFFLQIEYNYYINQILSFLGPLIFGIYLIHNNDLVKQNILRYSFDNNKENLNLSEVISLIFLKSFKIFVLCIIIDYFRHLLFIFLRLKRICIYLEKIILSILS